MEEAEKCWDLILKCPEAAVVGWFVAVEEVEEGQGEL